MPAVLNNLNLGWHVVRNPLRRSRFRWYLLGWIIAVGTTLLGAGLTVAGEHLIIAKGAFIIYAKIPGGLHTHGAILFALGISLLVCLARANFIEVYYKWVRRTLYVTGYYYGWSTAMIAFAPAVKGGAFSYVGVVFWGIVALLPAVLLVGPPPPVSHTEENKLLRDALEAGASPEVAKNLVERYFRGGGNVG